MALFSGGLLLRVLPPAFEGRAVVSGVGGLWFRCFADLASVLAPALTAPLIGHSDLLPVLRAILICRGLAVVELPKETL
jgi:hypothetical protein